MAANASPAAQAARAALLAAELKAEREGPAAPGTLWAAELVNLGRAADPAAALGELGRHGMGRLGLAGPGAGFFLLGSWGLQQETAHGRAVRLARLTLAATAPSRGVAVAVATGREALATGPPMPALDRLACWTDREGGRAGGAVALEVARSFRAWDTAAAQDRDALKLAAPPAGVA